MVAILLTARPGIVLAAERDIRLLFAGLYLAGALLVAAAIIALVRRRWRGAETRPSSPSDEMAHYRRLYEQGTISEEEYRRLRSLLGRELRRSVDLLPAKAPAASAAQKPAENSPGPDPRVLGERGNGEPPGPPTDEPKPPTDGIQPA
jgi:hypothetical protein